MGFDMEINEFNNILLCLVKYSVFFGGELVLYFWYIDCLIF